MSSLSLILEGVGAAFRFLSKAWTKAWGSMVIAGVLLGAIWATGAMTLHSPWRWTAICIALISIVVVDGGLYRLAIGDTSPGPGGLQWARVEWRLSAVMALSLVFLFVLGLLAFVVVLAFAFAVASAGRGFVTALPMTWAGAVDFRGRAVVAFVGVLALAGLVWAGIRISFSAAASVASGRVQVLASWPNTRGLVLPIIVGTLLLAAGPVGLAVAGLTVVARVGDLTPATSWAVSLVAGIFVAGGWRPLNVGLMAYLYKHRQIR
jgi:hypothetical protein